VTGSDKLHGHVAEVEKALVAAATTPEEVEGALEALQEEE